MNRKKVYFLDRVIYFFSDESAFVELPHDDFFLSRSKSEDSMLSDFKLFMKQNEVTQLVFFGKSFLKSLKLFSSIFKIIEAAGGLIENEKGEFLFIFRNGKWDLPKGKIDPGEKKKAAALREVEEECGLKKAKIHQQLISTYHMYEWNEKIVFKVTYWYKMIGDSSQKLKPQLEEGITKIKWIKSEKFNTVRKNTYPSVLDVLESIN